MVQNQLHARCPTYYVREKGGMISMVSLLRIPMSIVKEDEYFGNICSTHLQRVVDLVLGVTGRGVNKSRSRFQRFYVSSRPAAVPRTEQDGYDWSGADSVYQDHTVYT